MLLDTVVLIPAYKPEPVLRRLCEELKKRQLEVLVVDDGSGASFAPLFDACRPFATVIGYERNGGKGHALKFGLAYIREHLPDRRYIVTADADGQHAVDDIVRCAERVGETGAFVIGARAFAGKVPIKSRIGNLLTRFDYAVTCARYLEDNQTGLRAFECSDIDWLLYVDGERYEYELNVLLYAGKRNMRIEEVPIETIYLNDNSGSHFDPVRDTLRLHQKVLIASAPSLLAIAEGYLLALVLFYERPLSALMDAWWYPLLCLLCMAALAAGMSFLMNTFMYFISRGKGKRFCSHRLLSSCVRLLFDGLSVLLLHTLLGMPFWAALLLAVAGSTVPMYWFQKTTRRYWAFA